MSDKQDDKKTIRTDPQKLRRAVMKQVHETRARLEKECPGALESVRAAINAKQKGPEPTAKPQSQTVSVSRDSDQIPIDRQKNLEAILKFTALKPDAKFDDLKAALKKLLN